MGESLYERIGGEAAITAAVTEFYDRVLADDELAPFFEGISTGVLIQKQVAFMTMAFGGPHDYTGRDLRSSHARLVARGLTDAHFDRVTGHLSETLSDLGVPDSERQEALTLIGGTRDDVLAR